MTTRLRSWLGTTLLLGSVLVLFAVSLLATIRLTEQRDWISAPAFWAARLGLLAANFLVAAAAFYWTVVRHGARPGPLRKTASVLYSLFLFYLLLEGVFLFIPRTHNVGYSLAAQTWYQYYWGPLNHYRYRDRPFDEAAIAGKTKILVIGDSITAGQGIASIADRYPDLLQSKLPPRYRVFTLGANGADTQEEFRRLIEFPIKPDILVLQYFGNDIEGLLRETGRGDLESRPYQNVPRILRPLVMGSHLINFVYWQFPQADILPYTKLVLGAYSDPHLLHQHLADLHRFVEYSHSRRVPLIVLIFPFLEDLQTSRVFIEPVERSFAGTGTIVLDVSKLVAGLPLRRRVVNFNDRHPSKLVHSLVAAELYEMLVRNRLITD